MMITATTPPKEHEHAGDGEARNQVFDEQCAE